MLDEINIYFNHPASCRYRANFTFMQYITADIAVKISGVYLCQREAGWLKFLI
ncbi:MAG: hypothetical protein ACR2MG_19795 [Pyrinomonadaceae bacterium]